MSAPLWAKELAATFWSLAGEPGPFPRRVRRGAGRAFPLTFVDRPGLCLAGVLRWLRDVGVDVRLAPDERPLRACLVARGGCGFVFLDANDDETECRFSEAHEIAHFLRDYWQPRLEAERRLGSGVLDVFDGHRPPWPEERLHALLRRVRVGVHTHLLARDGHGTVIGDEAAAECDADRLAYELLAPAAGFAGFTGTRDELARRLGDEFGLPPAHAAACAALVRPAVPDGDPLMARLRGR